jgi:hypothetical protein
MPLIGTGFHSLCHRLGAGIHYLTVTGRTQGGIGREEAWDGRSWSAAEQEEGAQEILGACEMKRSPPTVEVSLSFFFSKGFFEFQYVGKGDG